MFLSNILCDTAPTLSSHLTNKTYVDGQNNLKLNLTGGTLTGNLTAPSFIKTSGTSSQFLKADGSSDSNSYALSSALSSYLPLTGGSVSGNITMFLSNILCDTAPTLSSHLTNKTYVDGQNNLKLNLAGGTMTGNLAMGTNAMTSSYTAISNTDIPNKLYVDTQISTNVGTNDTTQRWISSAIGNDTTGKGTVINPYLTIAKGFTNSAQYPLKLIIRGTFTENIALVAVNSNLQITTTDMLESQQTTLTGTISSGGINFTRLRMSGFTLNGGVNKCLDFQDLLGRHTFQNMYFQSSNSTPISVSNSFTNWLNFIDCDFTGLVGGPIVLPNLIGTAILRLYNCGLVNISIGTGWTTYVSGSTQLLSTSGTLGGTIVQLPINVYNAVLTTQAAFNALSVDGGYINMVSGLTGLTSSTLGCSFFRIGGVNYLSMAYSQLPPTINVLNASLSYDTYLKAKGVVNWFALETPIGENLKIIRGNVSSLGVVSDGTGYTMSTHVAASGVYVINFTTAFSTTPTITLSPLNSLVQTIWPIVSSINTSTCSITTKNSTNGSVTDVGFCFIAIGTR